MPSCELRRRRRRRFCASVVLDQKTERTQFALGQSVLYYGLEIVA